MKRIHIIWFVLLCFNTCILNYAVFPKNSNLTIYSTHPEKFKVFLDNVCYIDEAAVNIQISDINISAVELKIEFENKQLNDIHKVVHLLPGIDMIYRLDKNRKGQFVLSLQNEASIDVELLQANLVTSLYQKSKGSDYNGPKNCPFPVIDEEFKKIMEAIYSLDDQLERMSKSKQLIASSCIYIEQLKEILLAFDDEDIKIEIAKYAYSYTFDIGHFFKIADAFEYESSMEELFGYFNSR